VLGVLLCHDRATNINAVLQQHLPAVEKLMMVDGTLAMLADDL
jgi:hypothetical protein